MPKSRAAWFREYRKKNVEKFRAYDNGRYRAKHNSSPREFLSKEEYARRKKVYQKTYYERTKESKRVSYEDSRNVFFEMYGDFCKCCGESERAFLTVEHINGLRGQKRKSGISAYKEITKEYRPDLYETLCMNCNHARMRLGYCPHANKRE